MLKEENGMTLSRISLKQIFQWDIQKIEKKIYQHYMQDGSAEAALQQHRCLQIRCQYYGEVCKELQEVLIRGIYLYGYKPNERYWLAKLYPYFTHYFTEEEQNQISYRLESLENGLFTNNQEIMISLESLIESEERRLKIFTNLST